MLYSTLELSETNIKLHFKTQSKHPAHGQLRYRQPTNIWEKKLNLKSTRSFNQCLKAV